jgi:Flp pilus assembly protein TadG
MALVVVMLVLLMMGAVEFGRAFMVANMITNAARDGARAAALVPPSARPTAGIISNGDKNVICGQMAADIANVLGAGYCGTTCDPSCGSALCMDIVQSAAGVDPPLVQATVTGNVPYIFNLVGTGFGVNRSVSFRDEGR